MFQGYFRVCWVLLGLLSFALFADGEAPRFVFEPGPKAPQCAKHLRAQAELLGLAVAAQEAKAPPLPIPTYRYDVGELDEALREVSAEGSAQPVSPEMLKLAEGILRLRREELTRQRVDEAVVAIQAKVQELDVAITDANAQIAAIQACPTTGIASWGGREISCVLPRLNAALLELERFATPAWIGLKGEILGHNHDSDRAVTIARDLVQADIARFQQRMALLDSGGAGGMAETVLSKTILMVLRLESVILPMEAYVLYETRDRAIDLWSWVSGLRDPHQRFLARVETRSAIGQIRQTLWNSVTALNFSHTRSNPYLIRNYLFNFLNVAACNTIINFISAFPKLPYLETTRWYTVLNAGGIMAVQNEVAARNTKLNLDETPATTQEGLWRRIVSAIAGPEGYIRGTIQRLVGTTAVVPQEVPVLAASTMLYYSVLRMLNPLSAADWGKTLLSSVTFVSWFQAYLVVKGATVDQVVQLAMIPVYRAMAENRLHAQLLDAGRKYNVKVEERSLRDPQTGLIQVHEFLKFASRRERVRFERQADVAPIWNSPDGVNYRRQVWIEGMYRGANTLFDTAICIWMASRSTDGIVGE